MKFLGSRPTHKNINLVKADDPTVHTQNTDQYLDFGGANQVAVGDVKDAVAKKHEHANKTELDTYSATTQDLEYWVDGTNGSDNNDGSFEHPFATINKALGLIPQVVNHEVEIIIIYETYAESINLTGFSGKGSITIYGDNSDVVDIRIENNTLPIELESFNLTGTDDAVIASNNPGYLYLYGISCTASATFKGGFSIYNCPAVLIEECEISNHFCGIYSKLSVVHSYYNYGSSNQYGLCVESGIVYKEDIQPSGHLSNEIAVSGGQILSSRLAERDEDAVEGNLAKFDSSGNPVDSGIDPDTKADKDSDAVENNLAKFDDAGNPVDSGIAISDVSKNLYIVENPQTGTTYTLVLADDHKLVSCANANPITLTIPLDSSVAFPVGTQILILQKGAGAVTIKGNTGVNVYSADSVNTTIAQYSMAGLIKIATNSWVLFGDLE
jgi:hypothetical protein